MSLVGSDFLLAFLAASRTKRLDTWAGRAALDRLRITPLEDWPPEFLESQIGEVPNDPDEAEVFRRSFLELLADDFRLVEEELLTPNAARRDLWSGTIGNKFVIMSGGMSHGEAPTAAFDSLNRLELAGITRAMGFDW